MGILYSHIVFQPPSPPSYSDDGGVMSFRKARQEGQDSDDEQSLAPSTDATVAGSSDPQYVQHPLIYLTTSRGNSIPAAYFHQPDSYYTILFSHGNGEDLGITASYILELSNTLKTSALCYDYSGYGLATGKPSEINCYMDVQAAYNYLVSERRVPPSRIVLFGRSLGSGPTIELASQLGSQLGGVVLIAGLTSCVRVVFNSLVSTMKFDMFANIDKIERVGVPVFCVHGTDDEVVPFVHGVELSNRARFSLKPLWIRGAGHNNLESSRFQVSVFRRYAAVLREFQNWTPPPPPPKREESNAAENSTRRRESFGALAKAAGCFGVARVSNSTDDESNAHHGHVSTRAFRRKGRAHHATAQQHSSTDHDRHLSALPLTSVQSTDLEAAQHNASWSESNGDTDRSGTNVPMRRRSLLDIRRSVEKDIDSPSLSTTTGISDRRTALAL